jgi:hypothetical protein
MYKYCQYLYVHSIIGTMIDPVDHIEADYIGYKVISGRHDRDRMVGGFTTTCH